MIKFFLLLFLFSFISVNAQILPLLKDTRQNPINLNWRALETQHFTFLYPEMIEGDAQRLANLMEKVYEPVSQSLGEKPRKLTVVLHHYLLDSNAFVTLAPRRSEFYVTPYQGPELGETDWLSTLAIHEFRHVVQFEKSHKGTGFYLNLFLGEMGQLLATGWAISPWYMEGDAVGIETALTSSGRGRLPSFERDLRALIMSGHPMKYDPLHLGSFKTYYPNHYVYGYFLTTYLREFYGKNILEKIHNEAMKRAYNPLAFLNAVETFTGKNFDQIFKETMELYKKRWKINENVLMEDKVTPLQQPNKNVWTNYQSVQPINENLIFAYRSGFNDIKQFIEVDQKTGLEKVLRTPSQILHPQVFKIRKTKFAFAEEVLHPRWGMLNYQKIVIFDVLSGNEEVIKQKGRYFYPTLSHDENKLIYSVWNEDQVCSLNFLSLETKVDKTIFTCKKGELIQSIDWVSENVVVFLLRDQKSRQKIITLTLGDLSEKLHYEGRSENIGFVTADENYIYFQSGISGIDQIWRINLTTLNKQLMTSEFFGAYYPSVKNNKLYYSRYTPQGLIPIVKELNPIDVGDVKHIDNVHAKVWVEQEGKGDLLVEQESSTIYPTHPYKRSENWWNPHSWAILAPPLSSSLLFQVQSQDYLNNVLLSSGIEYSFLERGPKYFIQTDVSAFYPLLSFGLSYAIRRKDFTEAGKEKSDKWEEGNIFYGLSIPYSQWYKAYRLDAEFGLYQHIIHAQGLVRQSYGELGKSSLLGHRLDSKIEFLRKKPLRDLNPEWGYKGLHSFEKGQSFAGEGIKGERISTNNQFYLPGLFSHQSFFTEVSYEKQLEEQYRYLSTIAYVRGIAPLTLDQQWKKSFNYAFPLFYPEWSGSRYMYLKRVSMNLFYDHLLGIKQQKNVSDESYGGELWFDMNFVRNAIPVSWGVRYARPLNRVEDWSIFLNAIGMTF